MLDRNVEVFLDDLLEFVEDGKVIPIIGEELLRVRYGGLEVPLCSCIAGRLAGRPDIPADAPPENATPNSVVCPFLQKGGLPEAVSPKIRPLLNQAAQRRLFRNISRERRFSRHIRPPQPSPQEDNPSVA